MKTIVLAIVLGLAVPAASAGQAKKRPVAPKPEAVKELYGSMCQACHGPDGKSPLAGMGFVGRKWKTRSAAESAKTIREGVPGTVMMPFRGKLTEPEIAALAKYVRSLDRKPAPKK
jgi:mono/diheme cytochrome c family protein